MFIPLFFHRLVAHRHLHSFPTRRSSDLAPIFAAAQIGVASSRPPSQYRCLPIRTGGNTIGNEQDRKSTRLNSSHPSISYAVFCLKKKTKQIRKSCFNTAKR